MVVVVQGSPEEVVKVLVGLGLPGVPAPGVQHYNLDEYEAQWWQAPVIDVKQRSITDYFVKGNMRKPAASPRMADAHEYVCGLADYGELEGAQVGEAQEAGDFGDGDDASVQAMGSTSGSPEAGSEQDHYVGDQMDMASARRAALDLAEVEKDFAEVNHVARNRAPNVDDGKGDSGDASVQAMGSIKGSPKASSEQDHYVEEGHGVEAQNGMADAQGSLAFEPTEKDVGIKEVHFVEAQGDMEHTQKGSSEFAPGVGTTKAQRDAALELTRATGHFNKVKQKEMDVDFESLEGYGLNGGEDPGGKAKRKAKADRKARANRGAEASSAATGPAQRTSASTEAGVASCDMRKRFMDAIDLYQAMGSPEDPDITGIMVSLAEAMTGLMGAVSSSEDSAEALALDGDFESKGTEVLRSLAGLEKVLSHLKDTGPS